MKGGGGHHGVEWFDKPEKEMVLSLGDSKLIMGKDCDQVPISKLKRFSFLSYKMIQS